MNNVKCDDFFIFKIQYYGDKKLLDKAEKNNDPLPKQHHERAKLFYDFRWKVIEYITKKDMKTWLSTYMFDTVECALEEIEETTNIFISRNHEGWCTFLIPKKHLEIFEWIKSNNNLPIKILKKTNLWCMYYKRDLTWQRKFSKEFTDKQKIKHPGLYE